MGETCEVCGRVKGTGIERCNREDRGQSIDCERCYRTGYYREKDRAEKAEHWQRTHYAELFSAREALAAARRECDAAKDAHAYCLHMFPREWLTDPKNRNIFAAVVFKMLDEALAAPAAGEEGKR